jgi:two-component system, NtrC family, nitrogen regulation sensor histidine kinase NtrY
MGFKHYNRQLAFRVVAVILIPLSIGWLSARAQPWPIIVFLACLEVWLVRSLFLFLTRTNRQISFFIQAIKNEDTTLRFPVKTGNLIINELHQSLNELNVVLQKTKLKGQIKERYFGEIIKNIGTGVLVFNAKGYVTEANPAVLELVGLPLLTHLSQLDRVDGNFKQELENLGHSQKRVITLHRPGELVQLITRSSVIVLKDEEVRLVTLQDIRGELEGKELDSWVKLIRVLSHEIMNSLAPVTSIAQFLRDMWKEKSSNAGHLPDEKAINSTLSGLEVIGETGEGLIRFVQSYRVLTKVPVPIIKNVSLVSILERLSILVSPLKAEYGVSIKFNFPAPNLEVLVDEQMMLQVLINLIKNSAEALTETPNPLIRIEAVQKPNEKTEVTVIDNGPGVPEVISDQIFIPFFTTKSNGTGIGLSYSLQIMRAHGGTIHCSSRKGETVFRLVW